MKKQEADKIRVEKENEALKEAEATCRADANLLREELNRVKSELVVLKSTDIPTDPVTDHVKVEFQTEKEDILEAIRDLTREIRALQSSL